MSERLITQPANARALVIPHEYLQICVRTHERKITRGENKGQTYTSQQKDEVAAALLYFFERWTLWKIKDTKEATWRDVWLFFPVDQIEDYEFGQSFGYSRITKGVDLLVQLGFVKRRNNPNKGWDRTYQYQFQQDHVQQAVNNLSPFFTIEEWKLQKQRMETSKVENANFNNEGAIQHDPIHDPNITNAGADASDEAQHLDAGSAPATEAETRFGFTVGQSVYWRYEPRGGYAYVRSVPATVLRFTDKKVWIAAEKKNGDTVEKCVLPASLKNTPHDFKTLDDLKPIQRVIARRGHKIKPGQGISKAICVLCNDAAGQLNTTFGLNGARVTETELEQAFDWYEKRGLSAKQGHVISTMVNEYRDAHGHSADRPALSPPDPNCPICEGRGWHNVKEPGGGSHAETCACRKATVAA